jgi:hypothetical protein
VTWTWNQFRFDDTFPTALDLRGVPLGPEAPRPGWLLSGLVLFAVGVGLAGDALGRASSPRAVFDTNVGRWVLVTAVAMVVVQVGIYVTAP